MVYEFDVLSIALPIDHAAIHGEEVDEEDESSLHVVHCIFAIIFEPTIPLPSSRVNPDVKIESSAGSTCPCPPSLTPTVTFPFPSAYMTKIVAPAIAVPMPNPTH